MSYRKIVLLTCVTLGSVGAGVSHAQIASQFDFNGSLTTATLNNTSGSPTVAVLGVPTASFLANTGGNGQNSTDPNAGGQAYHLTGWEAQGVNSGVSGLQMNLPTTSGSGGFNNLFVRFDQRFSGTASRHFQLQYTTDGTNYITFGNYTAGGIDSFVTQTFDFSAITAANNNANFAVRSLAIFQPSTTNYAPTGGISTYATGGTIRYDMITTSQGRNWSATPANNDLTAGSNYVGSPTLTAADTVVFGSSATTAINVPASTTLGQMVFQAGSSNYTVSAGAGATLTLGAGIANLGTSTQTFTAPVTFASGATVRNNGTVTFNGAIIVGNTAGLQLAGTGTTNINSTYTGDDMTLSTGHRLGGIGTIQNEIHNFGGTVRGGVSDGVNNFGTLTIQLGSGDLEFYAAPSVSLSDAGRAPTLQVEASRTGVNTAQNSRIDLRGGASVDLELNDAGVGTNKFRIELLGNNFVIGENYNLTILTTDSAGSIEFNNVGQASGSVLPASSYDLVSANYTFTSSSVTVVDVAGASTLVLSFTPVPEPATVIALSAGVMGLGTVIRRRIMRS